MGKMKVFLSRVFILAFVFIIFGIPAQKPAASTIKCYTISSGNTTVYSNTGLTNWHGTIYGSDEVTVLGVAGRYSKVKYPTSRGRTKTGYIATDKILTAVSGKTYQAAARVTAYRRPGGASYGCIDKNDKVTVLGTSGNYTQVKYPVSGGYKYAFVTTSNAERYITGAGSAAGSYAAVSDGTYVLRSALDNNKVLDANGSAAPANGTNIEIFSYNGGVNQKFTISSAGSGWYKIICNWGNKALDVSGGVNGNEKM